MGGMAELFLAFIPGPGGFKKFVALKQILPDVKADESFVKMFLDEARITAAFNNANIGQVFDLGEEANELYLAMEFIAGQNLEQVIKRAAKRELPIPVGFAARVVRDTALGLHYAHHFTDPTGRPMAVVHRDVSPKNVMITWTGQVKVIDFGIAKARGRLNRTQIGVVKGTSGYMSPEQVRNEPLDGRTDLFAAGVMLHELLVGERLFTAPTDAAMMLKIVDAEASNPSAVNPYVTPELAGVALKVLSKKREHRFASGREFARAIEQSCPDLFEDEQVAEFMGQLFEDKIAITRGLMEMANSDDAQQMKQVVAGLTTDEREVDAPKAPSKKTGAGPARSSATPNPRPGLKSSTAGASKMSLPKVKTGAPSSRSLPSVGKSSNRLPKVPTEEETAPPGTQFPFARARKKTDDDLDATLPPQTGRSKMKLAPVEAAPENAPGPNAEDTSPPAPKKGGMGGILAVLVVLALLGGLGWAVVAGPLKDQFSKLNEDPVPVDTGPQAIDLSQGTGNDVAKPAWLIEKEKQLAEIEAEKKRQAEAEAALNDPEVQAKLAEAEAELKRMDALEAEQRALKLQQVAGQAGDEKTKARLAEVEKQLADIQARLAERANKKKATTPGTQPKEGEVEVVKDNKSAKQGGLGFLSMRSVNPSSASVSMNGDTLGSTPLVKVPIEAGVHKLIVLDGDGKPRLLSVTIEAGKTNELKAIDVSSLPAAN